MGISGPLVGAVLSLLVGVAGCASSPLLTMEPADQALLDTASPRSSAVAGSDILPCGWLESTGKPDTPGQAVGEPLADASSGVRRLPPVDGDLLGPTGYANLGDLHARDRPRRPFLRDVGTDHRNYYSAQSLGLLAVGVGLASVTANTRLDGSLQDGYQDGVRGSGDNGFSETVHSFKVLGDGYTFLPAFAVAAVAGSWFGDRPLGRGVKGWGNRSVRTVLVGAPPALAMQWITGGSRPGELDDASHWRPFEDDNGVSGHAFVGAVPFLTAAKMTDDPLWKAAFYAGSTLAGLSRVNDNRHYPSQAVLGWWMAYVAATAVDQTEQRDQSLAVFPVPVDEGIGIGVEYRQ